MNCSEACSLLVSLRLNILPLTTTIRYSPTGPKYGLPLGQRELLALGALRDFLCYFLVKPSRIFRLPRDGHPKRIFCKLGWIGHDWI